MDHSSWGHQMLPDFMTVQMPHDTGMVQTRTSPSDAPPHQHQHSTTPLPVPQQQHHLPPKLAVPRRQKRVVVTSCDSCRLRKLRCDAKNLPAGTACSQCVKSKAVCTFEDFKESIRPLIKLKGTSNSNGDRQAPGGSLQKAATLGMADPNDFWSASAEGNIGTPSSATSPWPPAAAHSSDPSASWAHGEGLTGPLPQQQAGRPSLMLQAPVEDMFFDPSRSNLKREWQSDTPDSNFTGAPNAVAGPIAEKRCRPKLYLPVMQISNDRQGPWSTWKLPTSLTNPFTGRTVTTNAFGTVWLLLERFYAEPTLQSLVIPYEEMFGRLDSLLSHQAGIYDHGKLEPISEYLLLAVVVSAVTTVWTTEPELKLWWKQVGWRLAMDKINNRLRSGPPAEMELAQALLVVGFGWPGDPESADRIILLETAIKIGCQLKLDSSRTLEGPIPPALRAKRICLYWLVYVVDKLVAVAAKRPASIARELSSMPLLTADDLQTYGSSNLTSHAATVQDAQAQLGWLIRLAHCCIALASILEDVQRDLYPPSRQSSDAGWTPTELQEAVAPNEAKLVEWCKSFRDLIRDASECGSTCRLATEAVVAQLHLVQIQLYQLSLRVDHQFNQTSATPGQTISSAQAESSPQHDQKKTHFGTSNHKALMACLESAWHLVQRSGIIMDQSTQGIAAVLSSENGIPIADSGPTSFAILKASHLVRFLSQAWDEWNDGFGMLQALRLVPKTEPVARWHEIGQSQQAIADDRFDTSNEWSRQDPGGAGAMTVRPLVDVGNQASGDPVGEGPGASTSSSHGDVRFSINGLCVAGSSDSAKAFSSHSRHRSIPAPLLLGPAANTGSSQDEGGTQEIARQSALVSQSGQASAADLSGMPREGLPSAMPSCTSSPSVRNDSGDAAVNPFEWGTSPVFDDFPISHRYTHGGGQCVSFPAACAAGEDLRAKWTPLTSCATTPSAPSSAAVKTRVSNHELMMGSEEQQEAAVAGSFGGASHSVLTTLQHDEHAGVHGVVASWPRTEAASSVVVSPARCEETRSYDEEVQRFDDRLAHLTTTESSQRPAPQPIAGDLDCSSSLTTLPPDSLSAASSASPEMDRQLRSVSSSPSYDSLRAA